MGTPVNMSVLKAFTILKSFYAADEWVTCCELSRRAKLPQASGYRLLQTMEEIGAVVRGPRGRYRPGMLLISLSQCVFVPALLHEASKDVAEDLAGCLNATVHLGILEDGMVTYVTRATTPGSFQPHTRLGSQLEAYCTGLGKVLLASLPPDQLERVLHDGALVALTPHTITDRAVLRMHLQMVRDRGFAVDDRETHSDMICLAVPVVDDEGRTIAAMSVADHVSNMTTARQIEVHAALKASSAALSLKMYRRGPRLVA